MTYNDTTGREIPTTGTQLRSSYRENEETEIDLKELFLRFFDHLFLIIFLAILGAIVSAIYTFYFVTPMYEATSKLYILNSSDSVVNLSELQMGSYLASDYIEVFKTWEVHEMVLKNLGLSYTYSQMQKMLKVENPTDTRILSISISSPSAKEAAAMANEYAKVAISFIASTMATEEPNVMSVALVPTEPASPNISRNILLGFLGGFVLAIGMITIRFVTDDKIRTSEDVLRFTGMSVLAVVPIIENQEKNEKKRS